MAFGILIQNQGKIARTPGSVPYKKFITIAHATLQCTCIRGDSNMVDVPSRYLISLILFLRLIREVNLLAPSFKELQFGRFIKNSKSVNPLHQ